MATAKYTPRPHGLDREFFQLAISTGKVHVQTCTACGHHQHPPRRFCAQCGSMELGFTPTDNRGDVYSWTVSHFTTDSGWVGDVPYATVVVQLGLTTGQRSGATRQVKSSMRPKLVSTWPVNGPSPQTPPSAATPVALPVTGYRRTR